MLTSDACLQYVDVMSFDHDQRRYREEAEARERLTRRHGGDRYHQLNQYGGPYISATPLECVGYVMDALRYGEDPNTAYEPASDQDLDDALTLLPRAREELDGNELELTDCARLRGRTWDRIGQITGCGDRRAAEQRYRRLRERTPGYAPPVKEETTKEGQA